MSLLTLGNVSSRSGGSQRIIQRRNASYLKLRKLSTRVLLGTIRVPAAESFVVWKCARRAMAKYLLTFQIRLHSMRERHTVEQSEEIIVDCEPNELIKAVSAEKRTLEARVRAAVERIDPGGSSSISLKQTQCL